MSKQGNTLVEVFTELAKEEKPAYKRENFTDGRRLTITYYQGDTSVVLQLQGKKGGVGNVMIVPLHELINLVEYVKANPESQLTNDAMPDLDR